MELTEKAFERIKELVKSTKGVLTRDNQKFNGCVTEVTPFLEIAAEPMAWEAGFALHDWYKGFGTGIAMPAQPVRVDSLNLEPFNNANFYSFFEKQVKSTYTPKNA